MRVDDVGTRAGGALRAEHDGVNPPPVPTRGSGRTTNVVRALAVAVVVVLVVGGVAVIVGSADDRSPTAATGPTWERRPLARVFGRGVNGVDVAGNASGFVAAVVRRPRDERGHWTTELWSSADGTSWSRRAGPLRDGFSASVAETDAGFVALVGNPGDATRTYVSDDGAGWTRGGDLPRDVDPGFLASDGEVFSVQQPAENARFPTWLSRDGKRWARRTSPYIPLARLGRRAVTLTSVSTMDGNHAATSRDLRTWTVVPGPLPPRIARPLVSDRASRRLLVVQYEPDRDVAGGRLWTSTTARHWSEIASFHEQFPTGNPDGLVQSGRWWFVSGNRDAGQHHRTTAWVTPDLRHWTEMPTALRGSESSGYSMGAASSRGTVVGVSTNDRAVWIWHRPR